MNKKTFIVIIAIAVALLAGYYFGSIRTRSDPVNQSPTFKPLSSSVQTESPNVTYVYNLNTHKFHYPTCPSVDDMAEHNRVYWKESRDKLLKKYPSAVPCKRCNP